MLTIRPAKIVRLASMTGTAVVHRRVSHVPPVLIEYHLPSVTNAQPGHGTKTKIVQRHVTNAQPVLIRLANCNHVLNA